MSHHSIDAAFDPLDGIALQHSHSQVPADCTFTTAPLTPFARKIAVSTVEPSSPPDEQNEHAVVSSARSLGTSAMDAASMQSTLEAALGWFEAALRAQAEASAPSHHSNEAARTQLLEAEQAYSGPSLDAAAEAEAQLKARMKASFRTLLGAVDAVRKAKAEFKVARVQYDQAVENRKTAESHERLLQQWRERVEVAPPPPPAEDPVSLARRMIEQAMQAVRSSPATPPVFSPPPVFAPPSVPITAPIDSAPARETTPAKESIAPSPDVKQAVPAPISQRPEVPDELTLAPEPTSPTKSSSFVSAAKASQPVGSQVPGSQPPVPQSTGIATKSLEVSSEDLLLEVPAPIVKAPLPQPVSIAAAIIEPVQAKEPLPELAPLEKIDDFADPAPLADLPPLVEAEPVTAAELVPIAEPTPNVPRRKTSRSPAEKAFDEELRHKIGEALAHLGRESYRSVYVEVFRCHVTLSGAVTSIFERKLAVNAASRVYGVVSVVDQLDAVDAEGNPILETDTREYVEVPVSGNGEGDEAETRRRVKVKVYGRLPILSHAQLTGVVAASLVFFGMFMYVASGKTSLTNASVHPVEGQLTYKGEPLVGATVVLHPKDHAGPSKVTVRGRTDGKGTFRTTTYKPNDGAPPGEYLVTVFHLSSTQGSEAKKVSPRLASPKTTDIVVKVAKGANRLPSIELFRK